VTHGTHDPPERSPETRPERRAHPLPSPASERQPSRSPARPAAWPGSNKSFGVDQPRGDVDRILPTGEHMLPLGDVRSPFHWRTPWQAKPRTHPSGCRASRSMPQPIPTSSVQTTKSPPRRPTHRQRQASPRQRTRPSICQGPGGPPRCGPPSRSPTFRRSHGHSGQTRRLKASKARRRSSTPTSRPSPCCGPSSGKDIPPLPMNAAPCCASPVGAASRRASTSMAPTPRGSSAPCSCRNCSNPVSTSRPGLRSTTATTPSPSSSAGSGRHCAAWVSRAGASWTPAAASATSWAACRLTSPREAASPRSNWTTWPGES
jgi:hypothetical protein